MVDGHPFLYQAMDGVIYHVADDVTAMSSWSSTEPIVAFVDGDGGDYGPKWSLRQSHVQIILASSPKGTTHSWLRQASPNTRVTLLAADLWSPHELYMTGYVLLLHL